MEAKIAKILVSLDSDQALDRMLSKIKDGFNGGRITKSDLATWIISHFESQALDANLDKIRKDHFDQVTYLESVLKEMKQARKNGSETPDLNALLSPMTESLKLQTKKRARAESPDSNAT